METVHYNFLSILPPIIALIVSIWKKQIYISLLLGIWFGWLILESWNPIIASSSTLNGIVNVFSVASNTKIILYSLGVGGILKLLYATGGISGFINWIDKKNFVQNRFQAQLIPFLIGIVITIESSITALISGTVGKPLTDKYKISREKLAYICDSTSSPICILFPFNGWGAFVIGLLIVQGTETPVVVLLESIKYNFYPIITLLVLFISIYFNWNIGPMKSAEKNSQNNTNAFKDESNPMVSESLINSIEENKINGKVINFVIPVFSMVFFMLLSLFLTGINNSPNGFKSEFWDILSNTDGASSVLSSVIFTLLIIGLLNMKTFSSNQFLDLIFKGMGSMLPVITLLVLAFSMGEIIQRLGTGIYISTLFSNSLNEKTVVISLFLISCLIAFATGSSWGTFAIMVPIGMTISENFIEAQPVFLASVLGGGIFGDHCSPISDTTIISSMASGSGHIDHVRTQLPYALISALISIIIYTII